MSNKEPFYPKILKSKLNSKNKPASPKIIQTSQHSNPTASPKIIQTSQHSNPTPSPSPKVPTTASPKRRNMLKIALALLATIIIIVSIIVAAVSCNNNHSSSDDGYYAPDNEYVDSETDNNSTSAEDNEETDVEDSSDIEEIIEETIIDEDGSVIVVPQHNSNNLNSDNDSNKDSAIKVDGNISSSQTVKTSKSGSTLYVDKIDIEKRRGRFYEKGEYLLYSFSPKYDGSYRFDISDIDEGLTVGIRIRDYKFDIICSCIARDNPNGVDYTLSAGKKYFVEVYANEGKGNYEFSVGKQKQSIDINAYSHIKDSIQFKNQKNIYEFTAEREGIYRFDIGELPEGITIRLDLYNSVMEYQRGANCSYVGDGLTCTLKKGQKIYIKVCFKERFGNYRLDIGRQAPTVDATNLKSIDSSVNFKYQRNLYYFKAPLDGTYRFEASYVPEGLKTKMNIYNSVMEYQIGATLSHEGHGVTYNLKAGQVIYIGIVQDTGFGKCKIDLHRPNPQRNVYLNQAISGGIEFRNQRNVYKFTAPATGSYVISPRYLSDSFKYSVSVYNSVHERLTGNTFSSLNSKINNIKLDKGDVIYIEANCIDLYFGSYSMIISMI